MDDDCSSSRFPTEGLLPKHATQATMFGRKHGETHDGRGIRIAVLDTGVDPAADGLQTTTDGRAKVVDSIDCTGSGDVVMSTPLEYAPSVLGLSGRTLRLGTAWNTTHVRLGIVAASQLWPKPVRDRLAVLRSRRINAALRNNHLAPVLLLSNQHHNNNNNLPSSSSADDLASRADLDERVNQLKHFLANLDDPGPVYDCVSFHDGTCWRVVVDVNETGDLTQQKILADYALHQDYHTFGDEDLLNFSVKIYDDGDIVSIVTLAGSHGTHVAAIAAAHHPNDPALNGLAPGAQVVSLKIGDTRLGSMETGTGLSRALRAILDTGCQICNMSYGEDSGVANAGFWIQQLRDELVNRHGILFISSAGNAGPALSSVGSPGGTSSGVLGVGAYATRDLVNAEYALVDQVPENAYTWSSRGPTYDGDRGVTIFAPGAAITSVPQYCLKNAQLMNGTSMSSPNACGNIALIMSAMLQLNMPFTPYRIIKAVQNTAKDIKDPLAVGFIQTDDAFEYLKTFQDHLDLDIHFNLSIGDKKDRGIYLREQIETSRVYQANVSVSAEFRRDDTKENPKMLAYEQRLVLIATQPWIQAPEYLFMNSGGRDFSVRVDPTGLAPGLHFGEVHAMDTSALEKGPVFRVPVTVLKPVPLSSPDLTFSVHFTPGLIDRRFIVVPHGANFAKLNVRPVGPRIPGRLVVHLLQIVPHLKHTKSEHHWYISVNGDDPVPEKVFHVVPGVSMEVCVAQFWSSTGVTDVEFDFEFHGIQKGGDVVYVDGSESFRRIDVSAPIRPESFKPSISLEHLRKSFRPTTAVISPLKERDILPDGRKLHELILTYTVKLLESTTVSFRKPLVDDLLYDSGLDSVLWMVHDANKRMILFGDVYPKEKKFEKGDYTVRIQLRHPVVETLDVFKNMTLLMDMKLSKPVSMDIFESIPSIYTVPKKTISMKKLNYKESVPLFISGLIDVPKEAKAGDVLVGSFSHGTKIEGDTSVVYFTVPPDPKPTTKEPEPEKEKLSIDESVRDFKLSWLKHVETAPEKRKVVDALLSAFPGHLPTLLAKLDVLVNEAQTDAEIVKMSGDIVKAADDVITAAKENDVTTFFGQKPPTYPTSSYKKLKKEMDDRKKALTSAYFQKCRALSCQVDANSDDTIVKKFEEAYSGFHAYMDLTDVKTVLLYVSREKRAKRYGNALKAVNTFLNEYGGQANLPTGNASAVGELSSDSYDVVSTRSVSDGYVSVGVDEKENGSGEKKEVPVCDKKKMYLERIDLLDKLGWTEWKEYEEQWMRIRFPKEFAPF